MDGVIGISAENAKKASERYAQAVTKCDPMIRAALDIHRNGVEKQDPTWVRWAENWISGYDRSEASTRGITGAWGAGHYALEAWKSFFSREFFTTKITCANCHSYFVEKQSTESWQTARLDAINEAEARGMRTQYGDPDDDWYCQNCQDIMSMDNSHQKQVQE